MIEPELGSSASIVRLLGMRIDATTYFDAVSAIVDRARTGKRGYVCAANVHMVMEAHKDPVLRSVIENALLVSPDGMPLVWAMRMLGIEQKERVYGPTLAIRVCHAAAAAGIPVGLYGGHPESMEPLLRRLQTECPGLNCVYAFSPPFSHMEQCDYDQVIVDVSASGAKILLVGLGCPKQEHWMHRQSTKVAAVMLGVGAFFDFYSGRVRQAPSWMQGIGLEWMFRLLQEPRRLFVRYAWNNPRFVLLIAAQIVKAKLFR